MEESAKKVADLLKVLSNENRLMILCSLIKNPLTVSELQLMVPKISQSALSQHLNLLKAHGILKSDKSGLSVTYSIADDRVKETIEVLKKNYCNGELL